MPSFKHNTLPALFFLIAVAGTNGTVHANSYPGRDAQFVATFADFEYPEAIDMAHDGTLYVGILNTGEVKAVAPDGSQTTVGLVELDGGVLPGLTLSSNGEIFLAAAAPSEGADGHGILRMTSGGDVSVFAAFPAGTSPNHITFDASGDMLVSESNPGSIYRVNGCTGDITLWSDHPRLLGLPVPELGGMLLGANGSVLTDDGRILFVSNSSTNEILAIAVEPDGSAGDLWCYAGAAFDCEVNTAETVMGPDGLALDNDGNLFIASGLNNAIVSITQDDGVITVWSGYPLEWPTMLRFGTTGKTRGSLFTTNLDARRMFGGTGDPMVGVVRVPVKKHHPGHCGHGASGPGHNRHCPIEQHAKGHGHSHCAW